MDDVLDANLLLRFFLNDDPNKAKAVEKLLKTKRNISIPLIVISEVIWTLLSLYKQPKREVIEKIQSLLALSNVSFEKKDTIHFALEIFTRFNIDWIDAYIAASVQRGEFTKIYSYDHDFDKIPGVKRLEPK